MAGKLIDHLAAMKQSGAFKKGPPKGGPPKKKKKSTAIGFKKPKMGGGY